MDPLDSRAARPPEKGPGPSNQASVRGVSKDVAQLNSDFARWRKALEARNGPEWVERHKELLADQEAFIRSL